MLSRPQSTSLGWKMRIGVAAWLCCALGAVPVAAAAGGADGRVAVDSLAALLVLAIDSPSGSAQGYLTGPIAAAIHASGGGPLQFDIRTVRRLGQPGCSRLRIHARLNAPAGGGTLRPRTMDAELNYCRNGRPPASPDAGSTRADGDAQVIPGARP